MLFSYPQAREEELPKRAAQFVSAAQILPAPTGMIFGPQVHKSFITATNVDKEIRDLINAVTDKESAKRVDTEIKRRIVTSKIPEDVGETITEAVEVLGMQKDDLRIADIPLIVTAYPQEDSGKEGVVINVTGVKALADAMRLVWSKTHTSPYPEPDAAVAVNVMRMPPVIATAIVTRREDEIHVKAVEGWGRLVGTKETPDVFVFDAQSLAVKDKRVNTQESMIARNDRTQQIVKTSPFNASGQKITDDQARKLAADLKRAELTCAVFGLSNQKRWLLFIPQHDAYNTTPVEEPVVAQPTEESFTQEPEVEVVDLETTSEAKTDDELPSAHNIHTKEEDMQDYSEDEVFEEDDTQPSPEDTVQEAFEKQPQHDSPPVTSHDSTQSSTSYQHVTQLGTQLLEQCLRTIELVMREWLYDKDQPEDFGDLLTRISEKRTVPYKQRILSLWEMKRQGGFENPDAEMVRFGMETMQRFVREFS